jgi:hypothetical protein
VLGAFGATAVAQARDSLPARLGELWSGALQFGVADDVLVIANATAIRRLLGSAAGFRPEVARAGELCKLEEALADLVLPFDLELAACELDASLLLSLAPGDVVCLPHDLDAPVQVRDGDGRGCFEGDLRRQGGKRAVQLRAPAAGNAIGRAH